jgi:hypothetical protein
MILSNIERLILGDGACYILERDNFVLGRTLETEGLPIIHPENVNTCLAARIEGKSSLGPRASSCIPGCRWLSSSSKRSGAYHFPTPDSSKAKATLRGCLADS